MRQSGISFNHPRVEHDILKDVGLIKTEIAHIRILVID